MDRVNVRIEVSAPEAASLTAPARLLLESRIAERAAEMIDDLQLPASPAVTVSGDRTLDVLGRPAVRVSIDGQTCRQPVRPLLPLEITPLVNPVGAILYANRERLLTPGVVERILDGAPLGTMPLLADAVHRGCPLGTLVEAVRSLDPATPLEWTSYEIDLALAREFPPDITVEAGTSLHEQLVAEEPRLASDIALMRDGLWYELGVRFPPVCFVQARALGPREFRVRAGGLRMPVRRTLEPDAFLVSVPADVLIRTAGVDAQPARNPANDAPCSIVTGERAMARCREAVPQLTEWDSLGFVVLALGASLKSHADVFLTASEVQRTLSLFADAFPLTLVNLLERFRPAHVIDVLRALVREGFSIRELRSILETMLACNGSGVRLPEGSVLVAPAAAAAVHDRAYDAVPTAPDCVDAVRRAMKRYLTRKYASNGSLRVVETSRETEDRLRETGATADADRESLVRSVATAAQRAPDDAHLVLLTDIDVRTRLRSALEIEFPALPVLSRAELDPEIAVDRLAVLEVT